MKKIYLIFSALIITISWSLFGIIDLETFIQPEHVETSLYKKLYLLAKNETLSTILEIGSSCGGGSTEALVLGVVQNEKKPRLFCIEISQKRFDALVERYKHLPSIHSYRVSSVPPEDFLSEDTVNAILSYNPALCGFNTTKQDIFASWQRDIYYARTSGVSQHGIDLIKREHNIDYFDMVFIDGSDFTASAELKLIYGAHIIVLDDIYSIKNHANYIRLSNDPAYELVEESKRVYNGYAVFKRKTVA